MMPGCKQTVQHGVYFSVFGQVYDDDLQLLFDKSIQDKTKAAKMAAINGHFETRFDQETDKRKEN